ncbi:MAG: hypothetical protein OXH64_00075 [Rhodospirillaceae bacterium]|nr:hypothetical protein [Rhodospirillaceae bacterium]
MCNLPFNSYGDCALVRQVYNSQKYVGDTVGATLSATAERQTIFSGDGAVASKLIDKVTQIDRQIGITPQDASLDNMALFLIAAAPAAQAQAAEATVARTWAVAEASTRDYFCPTASAAAPAGRPKITLGSGWAATFTTGTSATTQTTAFAIVGAGETDQGRIEFDEASGMFRLTKAGVAAWPATATHLKASITKVTGPAFERVAVDSEAKQVRVAVRYVEDPDDGIEGRNIYIPRASVSPAGEAALKSRDTPQQFALALAIEEPDGGLAQVYIDGVPT